MNNYTLNFTLLACKTVKVSAQTEEEAIEKGYAQLTSRFPNFEADLEEVRIQSV